MTSLALTRSSPSVRIRGATARTVLTVAGWAVVASTFLAQALRILFSNHNWLVHQLPDDSYYYLEISRRLGRGEGFTFDGTSTTNGFHPLWQLVLTPVTRIWTGDDAGIRASLLIGLLFIVASVILAARFLNHIAGGLYSAFCALYLVHGPRPFLAWDDGMEGPVVLAAVTALAYVLLRWARTPTLGTAAVVGAASAALVGARLDFLFVILIVPLAMLHRSRSLRMLGGFFAAFCLLAIPAAFTWLVQFRHFASTSARIKGASVSRQIEQAGGPLSSGHLRILWRTAKNYLVDLASDSADTIGAGALRLLLRGGIVAITGLGLTIAVLSLARSKHTMSIRRSAPQVWAAGWIVLLLASKAAIDILIAPTWASAWYSAAQRMLIAIVFASCLFLGLRALSRRGSTGLALGGGLALCAVLPLTLFPLLANDSPNYSRWTDANDAAADWILAHGPDVHYGARDAGLLGYRLDGSHTLTNLDGLVNDHEFASRVIGGWSVWERARAENVDAFIGRVYDFDATPSCAREIWRSPRRIRGGSPVVILDLRPCEDGLAARPSPQTSSQSD